jgi:hypothetical protein
MITKKSRLHMKVYQSKEDFLRDCSTTDSDDETSYRYSYKGTVKLDFSLEFEGAIDVDILRAKHLSGYRLIIEARKIYAHKISARRIYARSSVQADTIETGAVAADKIICRDLAAEARIECRYIQSADILCRTMSYEEAHGNPKFECLRYSGNLRDYAKSC